MTTTTTTTTRRGLMMGAAGAVAVGAFDPTNRLWTSVAQADSCGSSVRIPRLDGELVFDAASIAEASRDFGGIIVRAPWAVLRPASVSDVAEIVRFANRYRLPVAMRGQGHSAYGQAEAPAGIVIDSRTLDAVHEISATRGALVDAGVTWRTVINEAFASNLTPKVLTDYIDLSVGGVLSVGGMGGQTHRYGAVIDTVTELTVVTGEGDVVTCSASRNRALFESVLGGLGQFGIIVQARIQLAAAKPLARVYQLVYGDLASFAHDARIANADERFDFLQGLATPNGAGGWTYILQGARWYSADAPPDDTTALAGLSPLVASPIDLPYVAWLSRVDANVAGWQAAGVWTTPHPWSDVFVPDEAVETVVGNALAALDPADLGLGVVLLYPFKRSRLTRPFFRVPDSATPWLFDILRTTAPGTSTSEIDRLVAQNRSILDSAVTAGGKRYPISAVPFSQADWIRHFGGSWLSFVAAKARFDPCNVLAPGQGIFRR